tara:strand:+ start:2196 stop:3056 length:861 start_codon:yes stop_codon:yes gene_type:complete
MKKQLETILSNSNKSFSLMYNPRLSDLFYWHFHSEYELVYIQGASATRHVGDHISSYEKSDLVLIGSNIPHLNFDYGVTSSYDKVVVHIDKNLIENNFTKIPELNAINSLFKKSKFGIAFKGQIKKIIGDKLFGFKKLNSFDQYLQLLEVLKILSESKEFELLHKQPYNNKYSEREQGRLRAVYAFVEKNYHKKIRLEEVAFQSNMTREGFCRYFKKVTRYTFIEFLNRYRISQSKRILMSGKSVSNACYQSGFESLSYYNRIFKKVTQENPSNFRKKFLDNLEPN